MNCRILVNGLDATAYARLSETRIGTDSTRRITTASVTLMGSAPGQAARYDTAHYDVDSFSLDIRELYLVTILDGRDGVTKLFEGQIFAISLKQTDANSPRTLYQCELNDYAAWLDRSVAFEEIAIPFPCSDAVILTALLTAFCPLVHPTHITPTAVSIQDYDYKGKTLRQIADDLAELSGADWYVDFDANMFYGPPSAAPAAPFGLSTDPDNVTTFPVRVDDWRHDFTNPINHCHVVGGLDAAGVQIETDYQDPVSIGIYGELSYPVVDPQITDALDAELRGRTMVLQYAYPIEQGSFTVWKDGLKVGQRVSIFEGSLGIDADYIIRSVSMEWETPDQVAYKCTFGQNRPDLESYLRLIEQRSRFKSTRPAVGTVAPGSISDIHIAPGGLHAGSITTVNANSLVGLVDAGQIGTVNATSIQGAITAGQIGSVNAGSITGVIVSDQLANGIIDELGKFAAALRPIPILTTPPVLPSDNHLANTVWYYTANGHFYKITPDGLSWTDQGTDPDLLTGQVKFYSIGAINAKSLIGLILAAQINSITAGQITGLISAAQIGAVNASTIIGTISAAQIGAVNATSITGTLTSTQIGSINAATITIGLIVDGQIGSVSGAKLTVGTVDSDKLNATAINVGAGGGKPGVIQVVDGGGSVVARIGTMDTGGHGGWFKVFGAGGTGYSNAIIKSDTGGNLSITNAAFSVSAGADVLATSPTTFDTTYSSLALTVTGGGYQAALVTRGLILYSGGTKVAALVRSPFGAYGELELSGGGNYILLGATGIRSDKGFFVGAVGVIDQNYQFIGRGVNHPSYPVNCSAVQVAGVSVIDSAYRFVGQGVLCPDYGIAGAGFNPKVGGVQYFGTSTATFTTADGKTVTVKGGAVVSVV